MSLETTTVNYPNEFKGFAVSDPEAWKNPKLISFNPKKFDETKDAFVHIEVETCGICASDLFVIKNEWSREPMKHNKGSYSPKGQIVGHEIVGKIKYVSPLAEKQGYKLGDRVGVGAQCYACLDCYECDHNKQQYCDKSIGTYNGFYEDKYVSQGGYSSHVSCTTSMCFKLDDIKLESKYISPLLCAGLTVFSPILKGIKIAVEEKRQPKVAIVGIGGLGHLALMLAKAKGCEVTAISRSYSKKEDALKMGAHDFIAMSDKETDWSKYKRKFDLILNCAASTTQLDFSKLLPSLNVYSQLVSVGIPEKDEILKIYPIQFLSNGCGISASLLGSKDEAYELLKLADEHNIKPWIEEIPICTEGVHQGVTRLSKGDVRYRFVLTKFHEFFGTGK
ncbi:hypothetical protein ACO0SA_002974 [Hanseniaspora valbyensis]